MNIWQPEIVRKDETTDDATLEAEGVIVPAAHPATWGSHAPDTFDIIVHGDGELTGQVVKAAPGDPAGSWYGVTPEDGEPFDTPGAAAAYVIRHWLTRQEAS